MFSRKQKGKEHIADAEFTQDNNVKIFGQMPREQNQPPNNA